MGERFLYFIWAAREGDTWERFRRAKLPLRYLSPTLLEDALRAGKPIAVYLEMTDAKGFPLTASINPDSIEWRLEEQGTA